MSAQQGQGGPSANSGSSTPSKHGQATNAANRQPGQPLKRACDQCNLRRVKCSHEHPCAHCVRLRITCTYWKAARGKESSGKRIEKLRREQALAAAAAAAASGAGPHHQQQQPQHGMPGPAAAGVYPLGAFPQDHQAAPYLDDPAAAAARPPPPAVAAAAAQPQAQPLQPPPAQYAGPSAHFPHAGPPPGPLDQQQQQHAKQEPGQHAIPTTDAQQQQQQQQLPNSAASAQAPHSTAAAAGGAVHVPPAVFLGNAFFPPSLTTISPSTAANFRLPDLSTSLADEFNAQDPNVRAHNFFDWGVGMLGGGAGGAAGNASTAVEANMAAQQGHPHPMGHTQTHTPNSALDAVTPASSSNNQQQQQQQQQQQHPHLGVQQQQQHQHQAQGGARQNLYDWGLGMLASGLDVSAGPSPHASASASASVSGSASGSPSAGAGGHGHGPNGPRSRAISLHGAHLHGHGHGHGNASDFALGLQQQQHQRFLQEQHLRQQQQHAANLAAIQGPGGLGGRSGASAGGVGPTSAAFVPGVPMPAGMDPGASWSSAGSSSAQPQSQPQPQPQPQQSQSQTQPLPPAAAAAAASMPLPPQGHALPPAMQGVLPSTLEILSGSHPLSESVLLPHIGLYFERLHPIMPVFSRSWIFSKLDNGDQYSNVDFASMLLAMSALALIQPQEAKERASARMRVRKAKALLEESVRLRNAVLFGKTPTLESTMTSFYVFACLFGLGEDNPAWFRLHEAVALGLLLKLHEPKAYAHLQRDEQERRLRAYWLLVITERAYSLQRGHSLGFRGHPEKNTRTLRRQFGLEELEDFPHLQLKLFDAVDEDFVDCWNGRCEAASGAPCSRMDREKALKLWATFQQSEKEINDEVLAAEAAAAAKKASAAARGGGGSGKDASASASGISTPGPNAKGGDVAAAAMAEAAAAKRSGSISRSEDERQAEFERHKIQLADHRVTAQWLLNRLWNLCLTHGHVDLSPASLNNAAPSFAAGSSSSNAPPPPFRLDAALRIARKMLAICHELSQSSMEAHGIGLMEKLYDVAMTLVLLCRDYPALAKRIGLVDLNLKRRGVVRGRGGGGGGEEQEAGIGGVGADGSASHGRRRLGYQQSSGQGQDEEATFEEGGEEDYYNQDDGDDGSRPSALSPSVPGFFYPLEDAPAAAAAATGANPAHPHLSMGAVMQQIPTGGVHGANHAAEGGSGSASGIAVKREDDGGTDGNGGGGGGAQGSHSAASRRTTAGNSRTVPLARPRPGTRPLRQAPTAIESILQEYVDIFRAFRAGDHPFLEKMVVAMKELAQGLPRGASAGAGAGAGVGAGSGGQGVGTGSNQASGVSTPTAPAVGAGVSFGGVGVGALPSSLARGATAAAVTSSANASLSNASARRAPTPSQQQQQQAGSGGGGGGGAFATPCPPHPASASGSGGDAAAAAAAMQRASAYAFTPPAGASSSSSGAASGAQQGGVGGGGAAGTPSYTNVGGGADGGTAPSPAMSNVSFGGGGGGGGGGGMQQQHRPASSSAGSASSALPAFHPGHAGQPFHQHHRHQSHGHGHPPHYHPQHQHQHQHPSPGGLSSPSAGSSVVFSPLGNMGNGGAAPSPGLMGPPPPPSHNHAHAHGPAVHGQGGKIEMPGSGGPAAAGMEWTQMPEDLGWPSFESFLRECGLWDSVGNGNAGAGAGGGEAGR
ncbi:hypothetical protein OC844_001165 [Tilletia horrida]|nr:hypothetical protein OC844_001165 [Tilletia horrida]